MIRDSVSKLTSSPLDTRQHPSILGTPHKLEARRVIYLMGLEDTLGRPTSPSPDLWPLKALLSVPVTMLHITGLGANRKPLAWPTPYLRLSTFACLALRQPPYGTSRVRSTTSFVPIRISHCRTTPHQCRVSTSRAISHRTLGNKDCPSPSRLSHGTIAVRPLHRRPHNLVPCMKAMQLTAAWMASLWLVKGSRTVSVQRHQSRSRLQIAAPRQRRLRPCQCTNMESRSSLLQTDRSSLSVEHSFVVGFPEDMSEREFQNMFLFAPGFEAALLKIPSSTAANRERDAAAVAAVSALAATLPVSALPTSGITSMTRQGARTPLSVDTSAASYHPVQRGPTADPHAHQPIEGVERFSSALTAAALTATATTATLAYQANKKQIIGFARFRSRSDAILARDTLSGRKIDIEKGCILKAEIAKKDLHIKRSPSDPMGVRPVESFHYPHSSASSSAHGSATALDRLAQQDRDWRAQMAQEEQVERRYKHSNQQEHERYVRMASTGSQHSAQAAGHTGRESDGSLGHQQLGYPDSDRHWPSEHRGLTSEMSSIGSGRFGTMDGRHESPISNYSLLPSTDKTPMANAFPGRKQTLLRDTETSTTNSTQPALHQPADWEERVLRGTGPQQISERPALGSSCIGHVSTSYPQSCDNEAAPSSSPRHPLAPLSISTSTDPRGHVRIGSLGAQTYMDSDFQRLTLASSHQGSGPAPGRPAFRRGQTDVDLFAQHVRPAHSHLSSTDPSALAAAGFTGSPAYGSAGFASPTSPTFAGFGLPRLQPHLRPDDNNAPISTVYIGGLPSSLPNLTGAMSAHHLEEALRATFSQVQGFKRLSYRQKSQG